jgi:hypothetical protein
MCPHNVIMFNLTFFALAYRVEKFCDWNLPSYLKPIISSRVYIQKEAMSLK